MKIKHIDMKQKAVVALLFWGLTIFKLIVNMIFNFVFWVNNYDDISSMETSHQLIWKEISFKVRKRILLSQSH